MFIRRSVTQAGSPGQPTSDTPAMAQTGQPSEAAPASTPGAPATAADTGAMADAADTAMSADPSALGTGFVPNSPEATAAQIAGAQAMAQAAETLASAPSLATAQAQAEGTTPTQAAQNAAPPSIDGASQQGQLAPSSSLASSGGVSIDGQQTENAASATGDLQMQPDAQGDSRTASDNRDADLRSQTFQDEPWFARLPPTLRQAIQAQARRRAPRGYEERLRRYFESSN